MASKDQMALSRYGCMYDKLSVFGKRDIDRAFQEPVYSTTLPVGTEEILLRQSNVKLTEQLQAVTQENEDLWEQLNEARTELEELRSQFNPPLS